MDKWGGAWGSRGGVAVWCRAARGMAPRQARRLARWNEDQRGGADWAEVGQLAGLAGRGLSTETGWATKDSAQRKMGENKLFYFICVLFKQFRFEFVRFLNEFKN
jgi:hypothetical protein